MLFLIGLVLSRKRTKVEHRNVISYEKARNKIYNDVLLLFLLFWFANLMQRGEEEISFSLLCINATHIFYIHFDLFVVFISYNICPAYIYMYINVCDIA